MPIGIAAQGVSQYSSNLGLASTQPSQQNSATQTPAAANTVLPSTQTQTAVQESTVSNTQPAAATQVVQQSEQTQQAVSATASPSTDSNAGTSDTLGTLIDINV